MVSREQIKAARVLVGVDQRDLADRAGVSLVTLRRLEGHAEYSDLVASASVGKVVAVLQGMGVRFLDAGDAAPGPGVALMPGVPTRALRAPSEESG
jgi:transcriptional regulator with XRE-family HTH domain